MKFFNPFKAGFGSREEAVGMTRGVLVELIAAEFLRQMGNETTEDQLLFPASFTVYMTASDFEDRKSGFPFTVKELVNRFNREVLRRKKSKYPDYVAHSKFWFFKFCVFPEGGQVVVKGKVHETLPDGEVLIKCDLVPEEEIKKLDLPSSAGGKRVVTTIVNEAPVVSTGAINAQAVKGVTTKPGFVYIVEFANFEKLSADAFSEPVKSTPRTSLGTLEVLGDHGFLVDGREVFSVEIASPDLYISGKNDAASINGIPVLRLNTDEVVSTHILLHSDPSGVYKVKAKGPARAGGIRLDPQSDLFQEIKKEDQIIISDEIVIVIH